MPNENPQSRWWRVDPASGVPITTTGVSEAPDQVYIGDDVIDAAGAIVTHIEASFGGSRYFSDEEIRRLILAREIPASMRPYPEASAELLECVDHLWEWMSQIYNQRWHREPNGVEYRLIADFVIWALLPDSSHGSPPLFRLG